MDFEQQGIETTPMAQLMTDMSDMLSTFRALAESERKNLLGLGWDEKNAEAVAAAVYGTMLTLATASFNLPVALGETNQNES